MGTLALLCLLLPGSLALLSATIAPLLARPAPYALALAGLLLFFTAWSLRRPQPVHRQARWILYLLFISIAEEIAFRLVLPSVLRTGAPPASGLAPLYAHLVSNLVFAGIHFFTLRWKFRYCVMTFLGGMGLSYMMRHGDLTLLVMVHWLGTFLNTPYPPPDRKQN
jgi:hypothetical protein